MKKLYKKTQRDKHTKHMHFVNLSYKKICKSSDWHNISYWNSADNLHKSDLLYNPPYLKKGHILNIGAWQEAKRLDIIRENND